MAADLRCYNLRHPTRFPDEAVDNDKKGYSAGLVFEALSEDKNTIFSNVPLKVADFQKHAL